jgi:hypothetical protein
MEVFFDITSGPLRQERGRLAREFLLADLPGPVFWCFTRNTGRLDGAHARSRFDGQVEVRPGQPRSTQVNPNNIYNIHIAFQIQPTQPPEM